MFSWHRDNHRPSQAAGALSVPLEGEQVTQSLFWGGRDAVGGTHVSRGSMPLAHVMLSHWVSLTKHKLKDKIMKTIKTVTTEH